MMARARNIKPGLFENELLGNADPLLTILFSALWCLADKAGRLEDRPEKIDSFAFRYQKNEYRKSVKTDELLFELQRMGFIIRYINGTQTLIQVNNFKKHQSPHHTERESILTEYDSKSMIIKEREKVNGEHPLSAGCLPVVKRSDSLIPDCLIPDSLIPDSRKKSIANSPQKKEKSLDLDFEEFWQRFPKRTGANKTQTRKTWDGNLKTGVDIMDMVRGCDRYRRYCASMQTDPEYILAGSTFLGPEKLYMKDWKPSVKRNAGQDFADRLTGRKGDEDGFTIDAE